MSVNAEATDSGAGGKNPTDTGRAPGAAASAKSADAIRSRWWVAVMVATATAAAVAVGGCAGSLGYGYYEATRNAHQRALFLEAARDGAANLTTIDYNQVESDVRRVVDSSTGSFRDDFQQRSPAFVDVVRQAQSRSEGTVSEAAIESVAEDSARVLVAVEVKTVSAGAPTDDRRWRMRIDVGMDGHDAKVSGVEFVP